MRSGWRSEPRFFSVCFSRGPKARARTRGPGRCASSRHGLAARSHTALLSLYALDSRLARARSELAGLRSRSQGLELERDRVQQEIEVVGGNLKASQRLLGDRLRALYEEGEPDAIAVLLGATSLDDAVTRLDELERSAHQGAQAARDARDGRAKLQGLGLELAARIQQVRALEARAERTATALESARANRVSYLKALARQQRLTRRQIAALDSRARQVVAKAQAVQSQTASAPAAGTTPRLRTARARSPSPRPATRWRDGPRPGFPSVGASSPSTRRDPARHAHDHPRLRRGRRRRHRRRRPGRDDRPLVPDGRPGARLGPPHRHDHAPLDCRPLTARGMSSPVIESAQTCGAERAGRVAPRPARRRPRPLPDAASATCSRSRASRSSARRRRHEALKHRARARARRRRHGPEHAGDERRRGDTPHLDDRAADARPRADDLRPGQRRDGRDPRRRVRLPAEGLVDPGADRGHPRRVASASR